MNRQFAKCYNITMSTYGTHLLGDERGSTRWDGTKFLRNDPLNRYMKDNLKNQPFISSFQERAIIHDSIFAAAYKHKFFIDALNVRKEHIHLLLCALDGSSAEEIVRFMKNEIRRALKPFDRENRIEQIWTKSFSKRNIYSIGEWRVAVRYVLLRQGSNAYMAQTQFAASVGLTDVDNPTALYNAFGVERNASFRVNLFYRMNVDKGEEVAEDDQLRL